MNDLAANYAPQPTHTHILYVDMFSLSMSYSGCQMTRVAKYFLPLSVMLVITNFGNFNNLIEDLYAL